MKETNLEASELQRLYDGLPLKVKEHNINFDLSRITEVDNTIQQLLLIVVLVFFVFLSLSSSFY